MSAAIYAARAGMNPLVIEGPQPGGQITTTSEVENFPGFPDGIDGFSLVWNMRMQAEKFKAAILNAAVEKVDFSGGVKKVWCSDGRVYESPKVIVATGAAPRLTGAKNEKELYGGKGVSTCATCDGAFFKDRDVVVIGGGDSACEEAVFLTRFCKSVRLIHRREALRASKIMADRALSNEKITPVWNSVVSEILPGDDGKCRGVVVENLKDGSKSELECAAVFVAIGHVPNTDVFKGHLRLDSEGYVIAEEGSLVRTGVSGVYVAGDCSDKNFRQAITASAMGAMAAICAIQD